MSNVRKVRAGDWIALHPVQAANITYGALTIDDKRKSIQLIRHYDVPLDEVAYRINEYNGQLIYLGQTDLYVKVCFYSGYSLPNDYFFVMNVAKHMVYGYKPSNLEPGTVMVNDFYYNKVAEHNGYVYMCSYLVYNAAQGKAVVSKENFENFCRLGANNLNFIRVTTSDYKHAKKLPLINQVKELHIPANYIENLTNVAAELRYNSRKHTWEQVHTGLIQS